MFLMLSLVSLFLGQTKLPAPTGRFSVGRAVFFWSEASRNGRDVPTHPRELEAFFYYPAEHGGESAEYFPGLAELASAAPETKMLQLQFGSAWQSVAAGAVHGNAYVDAPIVGGGTKFPALIFSPGLGAPCLGYSVQLEELASHGYIVVALEHGSDAALIITPDHTLIPFVSTLPPTVGPPTASWLEAERDIVVRWTADTTFALDQIEGMSSRRGTKFFQRLNLSRIGVFGHSEGGKAAARICQSDSRIRSCMNQDGEMFGVPFGSNEAIPSVIPNQPTKGPFVDVYAAEGFTDAQLAAVHVTRTQYNDWRNTKTTALRSFLNANSSRSYLITIKRQGYIHGSFTDVRPLRAALAGTPATEDASNLDLAKAFTLAFFDATLKNRSAAWKRFVASPPEGVTVESTGAGKR
jgi:hypothetical protein